MRSTDTRPRPRWVRAFEPCAISRAPVLAAILPASSSPSARTARPVTQDQGRLARAQHARRLGDRLARRRGGCLPPAAPAPGRSPSFHAVSAGRIRVAIWPGGVRAAAIAAAPSAAIDIASGEVLTQCDDGRASPSMSEVKRRVVLPVIGRVVADDVDHARGRLVGVVDIGEPVGEAGPEMQQGRGRLVGSCGNSRRRRRSRRPRTAPGRSACRRPGRAPRQNASPRCRGWQSTHRRRRRPRSAPGFPRRSSAYLRSGEPAARISPLAPHPAGEARRGKCEERGRPASTCKLPLQIRCLSRTASPSYS